MKAPKCGACGDQHWGRCPQQAERISISEAVRRPGRPALAAPPPAVVAQTRGSYPGQAGAVMPPSSGMVAAPVAGDGTKGFAPSGQCPWCDHRREANAMAQRKRRKAGERQENRE